MEMGLDLSGVVLALAPLLAALAAPLVALWEYFRVQCRRRRPRVPPTSELSGIIIGSGFSGICCAIRLQERGIRYTILEKSDQVGGTWWHNRYPGCACDIPAHLYAFSFAPNPDWSTHYPGQREIWLYLNRVVDQYDLRKNLVFGANVTSCRWDADAALWRVTTAAGATYEARVLIDAVGPLHTPQRPAIRGLDSFVGPVIHTGAWDSTFDPAGKRIGVIGTGASATQAVPALAGRAQHVTVFQRSPNWIVPRPDFAWPRAVRFMFRACPPLLQLLRYYLFCRFELNFWIGFHPDRASHRIIRRLLTARIRAVLGPGAHAEALARELTPNYPPGCKRILVSNDYLAAFRRPNVELVTDPVVEIRPRAVVTGKGEHDLDALILATGFDIVGAHPRTVGVDGVEMSELLRSADPPFAAHLGVTLPSFPNFFLMLGPNTALGHNSVVLMIEAQAEYVADRLVDLARAGARSMAVRREVHASWARSVRQRLRGMVWSSGGCTSWYLKNGENIALWPGFVWQYVRLLRRAGSADFELERAQG